MAQESPFLVWALRYIHLGWPVFPLRPATKFPLFSKENGGHGCLDATLNETVVRKWWTEHPNANIGIATGHAFWVLDVDTKEGGDETWDMLRFQHGQLPETIEQVTGSGGKQILYQLPDFRVPNTESELGRGVDTRGFHGYIVAPPSIHPETKRAYFWDGADPVNEQKISTAPGWLLDSLRRLGKKDRSPEALTVPTKIPKGVQHHTLVSIAGSMRRRGLNAEAIFLLLQHINETQCTEPGPIANIRRIADSMMRYAPDARYNVFQLASKLAAEDKPVEPTELPLSAADVEAAVNVTIEQKDYPATIKLIPEIAKIPRIHQVFIKTKLRALGKSFPLAEFSKVLDEHVAALRRPPEPPEGGGNDGTAEPAGPDLLGYPLTDSGNGERIALLFRDEIRYCIEMKKWLVWDGRRWEIDERGRASQKAKQMARLLHAQAVGRAPTEKWARASESRAAIEAALARAWTENGMGVTVAELDQHPFLLNCLNGVVDLRAGKLMSHDREYLITKLCHVNFDATASVPRKFLQFIYWAMGESPNPDAEPSERAARLVSFLQRAFGYALTGDASERCILVFWGKKGNNGKTSLLTLFRKILAEYSTQIKIENLMTSNKFRDAGPDLADLRGARFVVTSEAEKEHKLSEGQIKYLTAGADAPIKTCRKYENPVEFLPTHTLFMDCNYRPQIRGTDEAIWRRMKSVPFDVNIEEEDPEFDRRLGEKLLAEAPAILAWAARGTQSWLKDGLGVPPEVRDSVLDWRAESDPLKEFLEDCCEFGRAEEGFWIRATELSSVYGWWCRQNRERYPQGHQNFKERLESKGIEEGRSRRDGRGKQFRSWEGLRVKDEIHEQIRVDGNYKSALLREEEPPGY